MSEFIDTDYLFSWKGVRTARVKLGFILIHGFAGDFISIKEEILLRRLTEKERMHVCLAFIKALVREVHDLKSQQAVSIATSKMFLKYLLKAERIKEEVEMLKDCKEELMGFGQYLYYTQSKNFANNLASRIFKDCDIETGKYQDKIKHRLKKLTQLLAKTRTCAQFREPLLKLVA